MKILIGLLAVLIAGVAAMFLYLVIGFAEPKDMALNGLTTRLFVPADVRDTPKYQLCGSVTVSRSWQECGGICGVSYRLIYPSTLSKADLEQKILAYGKTLPQYEISVRGGTEGDAGRCTIYGIHYYSDFRSQK